MDLSVLITALREMCRHIAFIEETTVGLGENPEVEDLRAVLRTRAAALKRIVNSQAELDATHGPAWRAHLGHPPLREVALQIGERMDRIRRCDQILMDRLANRMAETRQELAALSRTSKAAVSYATHQYGKK